MRVLLATLFVCLLPGYGVPAQAQPRDDRYFVTWGGMAPDVIKAVRASRQQKAKGKAKRSRRAPAYAQPLTLAQGLRREIASTVIGGRPAGCPARFCGCGASLHLFGRIIPSLNLAANWLRFARTAPAPNMVAARRGHVFVLKRHIAGNTWLVFDANSGGHRTRIHPRSIAGYAIVNPRAG